MKVFKKDNGYTLIEIVLVFGLVGVLLLLLWTNYLSIHRTYIRASKKAQNLEEARIVINFITDTFRKYEGEACQIIIGEPSQELEGDGKGTVKEIIFTKDNEGISEIIVIKYNKDNKKVTFQTQEIGSQISNFIVERSGQLLDFTIDVEQKGNGVVPDQIIKIGTTVSLQYTE